MLAPSCLSRGVCVVWALKLYILSYDDPLSAVHSAAISNPKKRLYSKSSEIIIIHESVQSQSKNKFSGSEIQQNVARAIHRPYQEYLQHHQWLWREQTSINLFFVVYHEKFCYQCGWF